MNKQLLIIIFLITFLFGSYVFAVSPTDRKSRFQLARSLAYGDQKESAVKVLDDYLTRWPEDLDALLFRGTVNSWLKNWSVSEKDLLEVVRRKPDYTGAWKALANVYEWSKNYEKAISVLNNLIFSNPDDGELYLRRASSKLRHGLVSSARKDILKARSLGIISPKLYKLNKELVDRSENEKYKEAIVNRSVKDYSEAINRFNQLLRKNPEDIKLLKERSRTYSWMKNYPSAITDLEKCLRIKPEDVQAQLQLVKILRWDNRYVEALSRCEDFLEINEHSGLRLNQIQILIRLGRIYDAERLYLKYANEFNQKNKDSLIRNLSLKKIEKFLDEAKSARDKKDYNNAITLYSKVLSIEPAHLSARLERARTYSWSKNYVMCLRDVSICLRENPDNNDLWRIRNNVLCWQKRHEEALSLLEEKIKKQPDTGLWRLLKSEVLQKMGRNDESYRTLLHSGTSLREGDSYKNLRLKLARSKTDKILKEAAQARKDGKYKKSVNLYSKALETDPNLREALRERGRIYSWKKRYSQAEEDLLKCLENNPDDKEASVILINVYRWQGKKSLAMEIIQKRLLLDPKDGNSYLERGKLLASMENYPGAYRDLKLARKYDADKVKADKFEKSLRKNPEALLWEMKYTYKFRTFDPERTSWKTSVVSLKRKFRKGSAILEWWHPRRFGKTDQAIAIDTYFDLWPRAYGNFRSQFTEDPEFLPSSDQYLEMFQGFGKGWEVSGYYKEMKFSDMTRIYGGSIAKYLGPLYIRYRPMWTSSDSKSWSLMSRYYFKSADDYIEVEYGKGTSPLEILTRQDLTSLERESWRIRFEKFITINWGIFIQHSLRDETGGRFPTTEKEYSGGISRRW